MADDAQIAPNDDIPTHPEEMKASYTVRVGKSISVQATARITPAGVITVGITTLLVALAFAALAPKHKSGIFRR